MNKKGNLVTMVVGVVIVSFICLTILFASVYTIQAGHRGVLLTFGEPSMVSITEGLHFKVPLAQSIVKMEVRTQKYESAASASSKDLQIVSTTIAVNFHLIPNEVPTLFTEIGLGYSERIIQPAVQEVVKATTAKYTAEELIAKRAEVKQDINIALRERLAQRGIVVEDISITNFDFSSSFNDAIEAKVTAEQLKLKAEMDLQRIEVEAKQKITQAEAEAESLRLQKQQITPELVQLREIEMMITAIEKWDGVMPQATSGMPFIDVTPTN